MNRFCQTAASLMIASATFATAGEGPYIELTVNVCEDAGAPGEASTASARFVFDTSAPPVSTLPVGLTFAAFDAELWFSHGAACDAPFTAPTSQHPFPDLAQASLFYSSVSQAFSLVIESTDGLASANVVVASASAGFFPAMTALPASPQSYAPGTPQQSLAINAQGPALDVVASWTAANAFDRGRIRLDARVIDRPELAACSLADLAEPFGVHDFDDVLAFLSAFGPGCP